MDRTQLDQSLGTLAKTLGELAGLNASVVLYGSAARGGLGSRALGREPAAACRRYLAGGASSA